jgi:hypothetical protein
LFLKLDKKGIDMLDNSAELQILSESINEQAEMLLAEAFVPKTIMKFSRQTRLQQLEGQASIAIAKERKDPLYTQYDKHNKLRMMLKKKIERKYRSNALSKAKESLKNIVKGN